MTGQERGQDKVGETRGGGKKQRQGRLEGVLIESSVKEVTAAQRGGDRKSKVMGAAAKGVSMGGRRREELVERVKGIGSGGAKK